ncbi:MAG: dephospho-CoA kinase [Rhodoblastus sp.]
MILIGLTGSIGMGKSATSEMFREAGTPVYDADAAVHRLYKKEAVEPVRAQFPSAIVDDKVDRTRLSQIVLNDHAALKRLEAIVHPLVGLDRVQFLDKCRSQRAPACILDVPLLFETGGDRNVDVIAVVSTNPSEQRRRVLARPDMTEEKFQAILNKQTPDAEKRRRAHCVIDTGAGFEFAQRQVAAFLLALGV